MGTNIQKNYHLLGTIKWKTGKHRQFICDGLIFHSIFEGRR